MDTTRTRAALRTFERSRSPLAALPLVFVIAALLGISPVLASTPPSVAQGTSSGGFSSAPGTMPDAMVMPEAAASGTTSGLAAARAATARFHNLRLAKAAGYTVLVADTAGLTCIAEPGMGAMGFHHLNPKLLDGSVSVKRPEILVYAHGPNGGLRLVALEYLVKKADWDAAHGGPNAAPPSLFGQTFNFTPAGNRFGLPDFYSLHAWVWDPNPAGMFAMWNPKVKCPTA